MYPEELIQAVVECLVSDTETFLEWEMLHFRWKCAQTRIFPLSMASRQLRRICYPFLFAYVKVQGIEHLEKLMMQCIANEIFALCIRSLDLDDCSSGKTIIDLLRHLPNLSRINLKRIRLERPVTTFLLNDHPVSSIVVESLGLCEDLFNEANSPPSDLNLAKVILDREKFHDRDTLEEAKKYFQCGMQIKHLYISENGRLQANSSFTAHKFPGLCELTITMGRIAISPTWLPEFTRGHPFLRKISFYASHIRNRIIFTRNPLRPFLKPFVEEARRVGLDATLSIRGFAITRTSPGLTSSAPEPFSDWLVSGLSLNLSERSEGEWILDLAHSFYPQISILTLENLSGAEPFDELVSSMCHFSSLQVVNLLRPRLAILGFTNDTATPAPIEVEAAMIGYTSHIAQRIPTVEGFFIDELDISSRDWYRGWLNVQDGIEGRHTVGPLHYEVKPNWYDYLSLDSVIQSDKMVYFDRTKPFNVLFIV